MANCSFTTFAGGYQPSIIDHRSGGRIFAGTWPEFYTRVMAVMVVARNWSVSIQRLFWSKWTRNGLVSKYVAHIVASCGHTIVFLVVYRYCLWLMVSLNPWRCVVVNWYCDWLGTRNSSESAIAATVWDNVASMGSGLWGLGPLGGIPV